MPRDIRAGGFTQETGGSSFGVWARVVLKGPNQEPDVAHNAERCPRRRGDERSWSTMLTTGLVLGVCTAR